MKNTKVKGLTLVALVITVIVLIIITGVTISLLSGNDIIGGAKSAQSEYNISARVEKLNMILPQLKMENIEDILEFINRLKLDNIVTENEVNNKEETEEFINIYTSDGYFLQISKINIYDAKFLKSDMEVPLPPSIIEPNTDDVKPEDFELSAVQNNNAIEVTAEVTAINTPLTYQYKINDNAWEPEIPTSENNYVFNNLIGDQTYNISMKAIDVKGNETLATNNGMSVTLTATITQVNGNILNYSNGARVTWVSHLYSVGSDYYTQVNGGYTGRPAHISDVNHSTSQFWGAKNSWNTQGAVENDNNKNIVCTHTGQTKNTSSSTTCYVQVGGQAIIIINPRAYQGDIVDKLFNMKECYLASANSDGDVGNYVVYISTKADASVATNPNDSSWQQIASGYISSDGYSAKVYTGDVNFRFIKLVVNSRSKSYMELAAVKVFSTPIQTEATTYVNGNIMNYNNGARVTWVSQFYSVGTQYYTSINGGYTGNASQLSITEHSTSNFWGAKNHWNVQGAVENDNNKSLTYTHAGQAKNVASSTTAGVGVRWTSNNYY